MFLIKIKLETLDSKSREMSDVPNPPRHSLNTKPNIKNHQEEKMRRRRRRLMHATKDNSNIYTHLPTPWEGEQVMMRRRNAVYVYMYLWWSKGHGDLSPDPKKRTDWTQEWVYCGRKGEGCREYMRWWKEGKAMCKRETIYLLKWRRREEVGLLEKDIPHASTWLQGSHHLANTHTKIKKP